MASRGPGDGYAGGCRRAQGPPEFSAWGFAPSWHLVCARCGPSSLPPGVGTVAAHAAPYPATSSCCFWRSGPRIASRYSWRTTTLRGSVAVPQLDSMVGGKPRGRIFIWPNMDSDHGNRTSASAVPLPPTPPASAAPPASAGPPASANPQPPNLQEYCRRGPPFRPRVLVISGETRRLSSLSPFQRREGCDRMGRVVRCDKLRDGGLEVEFVSEVDAGRALLATSFTYTAKDKGERHEVNIPISVTAHRTKNGSKGIIFCPDLEDVGDEDIEDGLEEFGVIAARRIKAKRNGVLAPTHNIILTFNQLDLPKEVVVGYLKVKVRPYVPSPLRCFRCLRFGHTREYCKNRPTCGRCAATDHDSSDCRAETLRCINCDATQTPHDAFDRSCPELLREREIMALKVSERLTFREARDRYNATHPKRSYARVAGTAAPTQPAQQPLEQNNITQLIALLRSFGLQVVSAPSVNAGQLRQPAPSQGATVTTQTSPLGPDKAGGPDRDSGWTLVQRSPRKKRAEPPAQSPPVPPRPAGTAVREAIRRNEERQVHSRPEGGTKETRRSAGSIPAPAPASDPGQVTRSGAGASPMGPPPPPPPPPSLPQRRPPAPTAAAVADSRPPPKTPPSAPRLRGPPPAPGRPTKRTLPGERSPTESGSPRSRQKFRPGATGRASSADGRPRQGHPRVFYSGSSASGGEELF